MVNRCWVPLTEMVLMPEVIVGAELHPELNTAMVTSVRPASPRRSGFVMCTLSKLQWSVQKAAVVRFVDMEKTFPSYMRFMERWRKIRKCIVVLSRRRLQTPNRE
jgi:hypothetical protein